MVQNCAMPNCVKPFIPSKYTPNIQKFCSGVCKEQGRPKANPKRLYYNNRKRKLKNVYHMTLADWDAMLQKQEGRCAICRELPSINEVRLGTDHNHSTKKVRGLLCKKCNIGLERFDAIPDWAARVAQYLKEK